MIQFRGIPNGHPLHAALAFSQDIVREILFTVLIRKFFVQFKLKYFFDSTEHKSAFPCLLEKVSHLWSTRMSSRSETPLKSCCKYGFKVLKIENWCLFADGAVARYTQSSVIRYLNSSSQIKESLNGQTFFLAKMGYVFEGISLFWRIWCSK